MERSILMRNSFAVCSHWQICVNYILYRVCYTSQCMNRIIWTKKLLALPIKFCQVVHTRILFWKHLPLQDSCMIFLGWGMVVVVLLFLNSIIDFPAFYQTSVCLSCTAYILFLSRNSCYSSTVHTALLLYGCLWAQVCEHRYRLYITHCSHTATCNCWNCFCEVMEILGYWLSLVFFKALYFWRENDKELHRLWRKSKLTPRRLKVWSGSSKCCRILFQKNYDRTFSKRQIPTPKTSPQAQAASDF